MKKCQAVKKNGAECTANGAHIMMVWALGMVAYPQDKLPALYANHKWVLQAINVCGAHQKVLVGGKPINIIPTGIDQTSIQEVPNKPEEGNMKKVIGCECNGTGKDPSFWDECKCQVQVTETKSEIQITQNWKDDPITKSQVWKINQLVEDLKKIMILNLNWATAETKGEADQIIRLLIAITEMTMQVKCLKKEGKITSEQIEKIRNGVNARPTMKWLNLAKVKLNKLA
jgi:hypothetical protein